MAAKSQKKVRKKPASDLRNSVLNEYAHKCAFCGKERPHLHHIDLDPSNNDPHNLLPLCPNDHLNDVHNPTQKRDAELLSTFRKHKDPMILSPQFEPIFRRARFIFGEFNALSFIEIDNLVHDLVHFVGHLKMGSYYSTVIREAFGYDGEHPLYVEDQEKDFERRKTAMTESARRIVAENGAEIIKLLVEQIRYQDWVV